MTRPRLLFLSQNLPFPPDGGVKIRTYNILRLLSQAFDVTALCFSRGSGHGTARAGNDMAGLSDICHSLEVFPVPQQANRWRLILDHARSVFTGRVYTWFMYKSEEFLDRLASLIEDDDFDMVHVDTMDLSACLAVLHDQIVACTHHNVESRLLRRRAALEDNRLRRAYIRHQATLMEDEERYWCPRVGLNVAVSENDAKDLQRIAPGSAVTVVPNGVDVTRFHPGSVTDRSMVFVGGTTWFPNRDALEFFTTEIYPRIRSKGETAPVRWVGRASEEERRLYSSGTGIDVTGYVDDIRPYVTNAGVYIVPLRVGGGTRLKILDAWAMGKAVVSTSIGCEGLATIDGENILVRDTPESFADAVVEVLNDEQLRRRLGEAARETAERVYSWDVIGEKLVECYRRLAASRGMRSLQTARPV